MTYWGLCTACGLVRYSAASEALGKCPGCGEAMRISSEMPPQDEPEGPDELRKRRFPRVRRPRVRRRG